MVYVHLATGFEEIEALTAVDLLRRVNVDAELVSMTETLEVTGAHGITVKADKLFADCDYAACELVVLPGGMPGTTNLGQHEGLCAVLKAFASEEAAAAGKKIAAICAAPMVLGGLGLLEGKQATIYPGMEEYLKGAEAVDMPVVTDGNITTSQGPGTVMKFALALVGILCGEAVKAELTEDLILR